MSRLVIHGANSSDSSSRRFYHGTRADLKPGDLIQPGYSSNYTERRSPWVYFVCRVLSRIGHGASPHIST
jgi:hypothetical protein